MPTTTADPRPGSTTGVTATRGSAARTVDLVKVYGSGPTAVRALDGVTVTFAAGQLTAIMGPSGSGTSTLMHCVAGLDTPTSGQVFLGDTELTRMSDKAITLTRRKRVGFVFQALNLLPMLTAEQNILLPLKLSGHRPDPDWYAAVVDTLGLRERLGHRPGELSGGQQQRVAAARALVTRPDVIVADEPTGALDRATSAELLTLLARCVADLGQTVVMVTHDPMAAAYADRVVLLADGRLVGELVQPTNASVLDAMRDLPPHSA